MVNQLRSIEAWPELEENSDSYLLDVRTQAEWKFVGVPNLDEICGNYIQVALMEFPDMEFNSDFVAEFMHKFQGNKDSKIFCICRSGARSFKAAEILEQHGFTDVSNILDGFEGDLNNELKRSNISGWKFYKLPWRQD